MATVRVYVTSRHKSGLGLSRLRWKNRQKVLKIWEKSAQIVLNFRKKKKCFKFRNSARKFARG